MPERQGDRFPDGRGDSSRPVRIAVDAMGGEGAPAIEVEGALAAVRESEGAVEAVLVGREAHITSELDQHGDWKGIGISIVNAAEAITMDESPASAIRRKRDSSIVVATDLQKRGEVDGLVSAGNTGAVVAASLLGLGMLTSVRRPALASPFPTLKEPALLLDVGASVDSRPSDLLEFAMMGAAFAEYVLRREDPRVALMNIGEESTKGSELTQKAHVLLTQTPLNFIGNVEGRSFLQGDADVVVCDGFVGNVILKMAEGLIGLVTTALKAEDDPGALMSLRRQLDYAEHGGAPLLGVDGVVIIAHGSSSAKAIKNAVKQASRFVDTDVDARIVERLREVGSKNGR